MTLLSQPLDPMYVKFTNKDKDYDSIAKRYMKIHSGHTEYNWINITGAGLFTGAVATLALNMTWLMAFLGVLLILLWIIAPSTRVRTQKKLSFLRQRGSDSYAWRNKIGPDVTWSLARNNEIYGQAVSEWLAAVRISNNLVIHQSKWTQYLQDTERLVAGKTAGLEPDFERLKILKELMK